MMTFQTNVMTWLTVCFGGGIAWDKRERNLRFLEEALELVQACDLNEKDALELVKYVYSRPIGEPKQELGGVMITLAALSKSNNLDMEIEGSIELKRIWNNIPKIRQKHFSKTIRTDTVNPHIK